jgi:PAS domain S-box-containing protein
MAADALHYDPVARSICGIPEEGPIPRDLVRRLIHDDDQARVTEVTAAALDPALRRPAVYRCRIRRPSDGAVRWVRATGTAEFASEGPDAPAIRYLGTVQDVTLEEESAAQLRESEARLRLALDAAGLALWELDTASGQLTPSAELNRLLGFPEDAAPTLEEARSRYAPGEQDRVAAEGAAIRAAGGDRMQTTARFLMPDGSERHLMIRAQIAPSSDGPAPRVIGVMADVTEERLRELRLEVINGELRHRLLNLIAVMSAIVRRTLEGSDRQAVLQGRLQAFGEGIQAMLQAKEDAAELSDLLKRIIQPFDDHDRISFEGPRLQLAPTSASACALAFHELATNALKYGALHDPEGTITIRWTSSGGRARVLWQERTLQPITVPERTGFGSALITRLLFRAPDTARLEFEDTGVRCILDLTVET